jgi:SAM-dependent methyltransferase
MKPVPADRDAFGREMWAFFTGDGDPFEIVERDDGYVTAAPSTAGYFADVRRWPARQRQAIRFARGSRALDVGCGAGRVALHLQARGFEVTAIDSSPLAIRTSRMRGVRDARVLPFQNISRLSRERFDTVLMFGNNFGLFGSYTRAKMLLRTLRTITGDDAVLVAESLDPHATHDRAHLRYQRSNRRRGRMSGQIRIRVRFRDCVGPWFDYLLVSPDEMKHVLDGTGWKARRIIRDESAAYVAIIDKTRTG